MSGNTVLVPDAAPAQIPQEPAQIPPEARSAGNYTSAIYGTIVVAGVIAALGHHDSDPSTVVGSVVATALVFWLAHVWAAATSARVALGRRLPARAVGALAAHEWPMVEAAALPLLPVVLAWTGAISADAGVDAALAITIAQLVGWGLVVGRRSYDRWPAALLSGLVNGALGVLLVALKALVH